MHDARDYDEHARSVAVGDGFSERITGKPTAFRPPGYVYLLAGAYRLAGVERSPVDARIPVGRGLGAILGALGVALVGVLAWQLWGGAAGIGGGGARCRLRAVDPRRDGADVRAAVRGADARDARRGARLAAHATLVAGAARRRVGRPRGARSRERADPAASARARGVGGDRCRCAAGTAGRCRAAHRRAVDASQRLELDAFVPVTTQLGSALAGTYNSEARADRDEPRPRGGRCGASRSTTTSPTTSPRRPRR